MVVWWTPSRDFFPRKTTVPGSLKGEEELESGTPTTTYTLSFFKIIREINIIIMRDTLRLLDQYWGL